MLTKGEFLLSDHYGNRIKRDLTAAGYRVRVLPDREWIRELIVADLTKFGLEPGDLPPEVSF